jgi:hypothetical protein
MFVLALDHVQLAIPAGGEDAARSDASPNPAVRRSSARSPVPGTRLPARQTPPLPRLRADRIGTIFRLVHDV